MGKLFIPQPFEHIEAKVYARWHWDPDKIYAEMGMQLAREFYTRLMKGGDTVSWIEKAVENAPDARLQAFRLTMRCLGIEGILDDYYAWKAQKRRHKV